MSISANNIIDVNDATLRTGQRAIKITTAEGDIVIPVGVGSFVSGGVVFVEAQKVVTDSTSTTVNLAVNDNTRYEFTLPITSLAITSVPSSGLESSVVFTAGAGFTMSVPEDVPTIGMLLAGTDEFIAGKRYIISMRHGEMVAYAFN